MEENLGQGLKEGWEGCLRFVCGDGLYKAKEAEMKKSKLLEVRMETGRSMQVGRNYVLYEQLYH